MLFLFPLAAGADVTITTKYVYNDDGALTAITRQQNGGTATTTYLVWDNFVPDAADPTTGTVSTGNGTLVGYGPSPNDLTATFQFDARDRLKSFSRAAQSETYDYSARGTLASSTSDGDAFQFYYDKSSNAMCTNIYQTSQNLWSGYLGHVRCLNDGSEQVLMKPRKDIATSYDASQQTVAPYIYDVYGSQPNATPPASYDLHENPFQYTGEYRDPLWGGYYLRARWYHPDLPTFLSRDPMHNLNRYGYGGGNPLMHTDPSGMSFLKALGRDIVKGAAKLSAILNRGWYGHLDRFFLAPLMAPLQVVANPRAFWQGIKTDKDGIDIFLAASVVTTVGWDLAATYSETLSASQIYVYRSITNLTIGTGGVVASAADRGFKHFNWTTLTNGLEGVAGAYFDYTLGGAGYNHRYNLEADRVRGISQALRNNADEDGDIVILRRRVRTKVLGVPLPKNVGPLQENAGLGLYHEQLIAITRDHIFTTEVLGGEVVTQTLTHTSDNLEGILGGASGKDFALAGRIDGSESTTAVDGFDFNPLNLRSSHNPEGATRYSYFRNDSSLHVKAILKDLEMW
jgi:RHS repeat-associated protein